MAISAISVQKDGETVQLKEAAVRRCSTKWVFLKMSQMSQESTCVGFCFQDSCRPEGLWLYRKETPTQVFSCEYYEIFKNTC